MAIPRLTLAAFTLTFVPFAVSLVIANLWAEASVFPAHTRVAVTIWIVLPFAALALSLRAAGRDGPVASLTWSFGLAAFLLHQFFAVAYFFGGSLELVYQRQGAAVATANFVLAIWWSLDVALLWLGSKSKYTLWQRRIFSVLLPMALLFAAVVLKDGTVRWVALGCVVLWLVVLMFFRVSSQNHKPDFERVR